MTIDKYQPEPAVCLDNAIEQWQRMADQGRYTKTDKKVIYWEIRSEQTGQLPTEEQVSADHYGHCFLCDGTTSETCDDCPSVEKWPTVDADSSELVEWCSDEDSIYPDWRKKESRETVITMLEFLKSLKDR